MVKTLIRGDTVFWTVEPFRSPMGDFFSPADGASELTVFFRGPVKLSVVAGKENGHWMVVLRSVESQKLVLGAYDAYYRFSFGDKCYSVRVGRVTVECAPDDPLAEGEDGRTTAEKALADAEAALMRYNEKGQRVQSYTINNRSMTFSSASEILEIIRYWRKRVMAGRSGGRLQIHKVAFG